MFQSRIDVSRALDGEPVVFACFELGEEEALASTHAVAVAVSDRFRSSSMSADDVLEFRELSALADELAEQARRAGTQTVVLRPARLSALHDALVRFVESRDDEEWIPEHDRDRLACLRGLLLPLEELRAEALRAALAPAERPC